MRLWILPVVFVLMCSCKKDKPFGPQFLEGENNFLDSTATQIFVVNEGNFTLSNASITSHEIENGNTKQKVFKKANDQALGDVGQSLAVAGSIGFLAVNNSNAIIKVKLPQFEELERAVVASPRYSLITSTGELWVSSLNGSELFVLDTSDLSLIRKNTATDWLETLIEADNHVFACNVKKGAVDVYSLKGALVSSISVGRQPQSIVVDREGALWVLCDGGFDPRDRDFASLHKIDPIERKVEYTYTFDDIEASPSRLVCNKEGGKLYFINRSVYAFRTDLGQQAPSKIYELDGANFYGLGWIESTKNLVVTDAKNYVNNGSAIVLDAEGKRLYDFNTGVIPQHVETY